MSPAEHDAALTALDPRYLAAHGLSPQVLAGFIGLSGPYDFLPLNTRLLRRQFGDAETGFSSFLQKYPDHSLAGSAQYWLGETPVRRLNSRRKNEASS